MLKRIIQNNYLSKIKKYYKNNKRSFVLNALLYKNMEINSNIIFTLTTLLVGYISIIISVIFLIVSILIYGINSIIFDIAASFTIVFFSVIIVSKIWIYFIKNTTFEYIKKDNFIDKYTEEELNNYADRLSNELLKTNYVINEMQTKDYKKENAEAILNYVSSSANLIEDVNSAGPIVHKAEAVEIIPDDFTSSIRDLEIQIQRIAYPSYEKDIESLEIIAFNYNNLKNLAEMTDRKMYPPVLENFKKQVDAIKKHLYSYSKYLDSSGYYYLPSETEMIEEKNKNQKR